MFQFGAPDVVVVNVTKDAIWTRKAAIPDCGAMARPSPAEAVELFDLSPTNLKVKFPNPRQSLSDLVEPEILNADIDPRKYYPPDVYREPKKDYPKDLTIEVREMALMKVKKTQAKLTEKAAKLQAIIDALEAAK